MRLPEVAPPLFTQAEALLDLVSTYLEEGTVRVLRRHAGAWRLRSWPQRDDRSDVGL